MMAFLYFFSNELSDQEKKFVCTKCGMAFMYLFCNELSDQEKKFVCPKCGMAFLRERNLTIHLNTKERGSD